MPTRPLENGHAFNFSADVCDKFGWFPLSASPLHLPEHAFALHLLFENTQGLIDVVVANENLHLAPRPSRGSHAFFRLTAEVLPCRPCSMSKLSF